MRSRDWMIAAVLCCLVFNAGFGQNTKPEQGSIAEPVYVLTNQTILDNLKLQKKEKANKKSDLWRMDQDRFVTKAFFCKLENRVERKSKLPLRIRVGTLEYANHLEGKNNVINYSSN